MKTKNIFKTLAFAMMMPAMLLTTACSSEDELANNKNIDNTEAAINKGFSLPVTVNVTRQGDSDMRAVYTDNGDGTGSLAFGTGDKLFVNGWKSGMGSFAGTLDYVPATGKFSGTIYTENEWTGTADDLFAAANNIGATLLPAGYADYGFINYIDGAKDCDDYIQLNVTYTCATSKATAVEQFSSEVSYAYSSGFALAPQYAILNFTITGLAASTNVAVSLTGSGYNVTGTVTTDGSGTATFAAGVYKNEDLKDFSLTVGGNPITLVSSSKELTAGKIYNITRAVTPPTLAQTMTTAGMTVKVKYNYYNEENYCLFSSNGDGTYTFQSGDGWAGGDEGCAKALVVEGGKLVFKQNLYNPIDEQWSNYGFSATFDTSNNSYIQFVGPWTDSSNPSFISVEVNSVPIALTKIITVADLVKEDGDFWSDIIDKNSDKIKTDGYYVMRKSDNAKLQHNMWGDDWQDVSIYDDYHSMDTYKFEGD